MSIALKLLPKKLSRAESANKLALEVEKERDTAEKAVEELKRQMYPTRALTDDEAGNARANPSQCTSRVSQ